MITKNRELPYVLITGAAHGIGEEFSKTYQKLGYGLLLIDKDKKKLQKMEEYLGNEHFTLTLDLSKEKSIQEIEKFCQKNNLQINILINNCALPFGEAFKDTEIEYIKTILNVNIQSLVHLCQIFSQKMANQKSGHIINVASIAAFMPGCPLSSLYFASKSFVFSFSEALALEMEPHHVAVSVLCPGIIQTNILKPISQRLKKVSYGSQKTKEIEDIFNQKGMDTKQFIQNILPQIKKKKLIITNEKKLTLFSILIGWIPRSLIRKIYKKRIIQKKYE